MQAIQWFFRPDSVFATERLARGEWKAVPSLVKNAFKRSIFIAPGLYLCDIKGKQLVAASLLSSAFVSLSLVGYFLITPDYTTDLCATNPK